MRTKIAYLSLAEQLESTSVGVQFGADDVVGVGGGIEDAAVLADLLPERLGQPLRPHSRPLLLELRAQLLVRLLLLRQQARRLNSTIIMNVLISITRPSNLFEYFLISNKQRRKFGDGSIESINTASSLHL